MLVHAAWVLPIGSPPLRDGAVLVREGRIADVGPLDELERRHPGEQPVRHDGCVMLPGLVNAHTHLALTVLGGLLPSMPFAEWLPLLVRAMRALDDEALEASVARGARACLASGVTVVGEIAYGTVSRRVLARLGLAGVCFAEVLGIDPDALDDALANAGYPGRESEAGPGIRLCAGISPHSPYTSSPRVLGDASARARADGVAFSIHVAESRAEAELFEHGGGALSGTAGRLAAGVDSASGTTPVRYLAEMGVLEGALAIHCVQVDDTDIGLLARHAAGVALCPRSNAHLHEGPAPVAALERTGVRLALGTDSLGSTPDLNLLAEARAVRTLAPHLAAERIVRMATADGAAALGLGDRFGTLAPGYQADLAVFACDAEGADPYQAVLATGGEVGSAVAVMAAGEWRVRDGTLVVPPDPALDAAFARGRSAAAAALA